MGRRLVERHLGSYRLTALGEELRPAAEGVEAAVAAFERDLAARDKGLTGTVRVTCGSGVAACLRRTPLIDAFHARYPGLRVELVISDRVLDLSKGEAEIAIRIGEPKDEALVGRKIADVSWSVYASRGYLERYGRPDNPEDLKGHLVVGCDGPIADYPGARWQRSVAHHATVAARCDHWQGLMLAVRTGAGLAAMPHFQGDNESDLVRVIDDIGLVMPCYLLMHRDMQHTPECGPSPISCPRKSSRFARFCRMVMALPHRAEAFAPCSVPIRHLTLPPFAAVEASACSTLAPGAPGGAISSSLSVRRHPGARPRSAATPAWAAPTAPKWLAALPGQCSATSKSCRLESCAATIQPSRPGGIDVNSPSGVARRSQVDVTRKEPLSIELHFVPMTKCPAIGYGDAWHCLRQARGVFPIVSRVAPDMARFAFLILVAAMIVLAEP